jgi:hypothetical protein
MKEFNVSKGTSLGHQPSIQTRAKYFFIVPYALMELERSRETYPRADYERMKSRE